MIIGLIIRSPGLPYHPLLIRFPGARHLVAAVSDFNRGWFMCLFYLCFICVFEFLLVVVLNLLSNVVALI